MNDNDFFNPLVIPNILDNNGNPMLGNNFYSELNNTDKKVKPIPEPDVAWGLLLLMISLLAIECFKKYKKSLDTR